VDCSNGRAIRPRIRMVDTTFLGSRGGSPAGTPRDRSRTRAGAEHAATAAQPEVRRSRSAPESRNATGVAAAEDADASARRGRDCARRSAAASALQDGPKFFKKVPDNVMLHPEVRERLVRLLAKGQDFALVACHDLVQGIETRQDPTQLCFDGVKAGVRCAGHDVARRDGQRGANGFRVLGHNRSRLRPCCLGVRLVVGAVPRDGLRQPLLEVRRGFEAEALACSSSVQPSARLPVRL
jgi:hypothetical protein